MNSVIRVPRAWRATRALDKWSDLFGDLVDADLIRRLRDGLGDASDGSPRNLIRTEAQAQRAGPGVYRCDGVDGLYLTVSDTGAASYYHRFRGEGARHTMGLGSRARVKLEDARRRVRAAAALRDRGVNPLKEKRAARTRALEAAANAVPFETALDAFLGAQKWKRDDAVRNWRGQIAKYALPVFGKLPVAEIGVQHCAEAIKAAIDAGFDETARRLRDKLVAVFKFCVQKGWLAKEAGNPAATAFAPRRPDGEGAHFARVELDDAPAIFRALRDHAKSDTVLMALVLGIACALRPSEAIEAKWSETDIENELWVIPAARMKTARDHCVPLNPIALEILRERAMTKKDSYAVFVDRRGRPLTYDALSNALRGPKRDKLNIGTPHSWRSVFADWARKYGKIDEEVRELCLAHVFGKVKGAYARDKLIDERRKALNAYADWLLDKKVVKLVKRRA